MERRGTLRPESLYAFLGLFVSVSSWREAFWTRADLTHVNDLVLDLKDFRILEEAVTRAILADFSIADTASAELQSVRSKIEREKALIDQTAAALMSRYRDFLSGGELGIKNGLPVLPVKNTFRSRVKGVVEEISNSGETYFIVPVEILDVVNAIYALREREKNEEEKVLKSLSEQMYSRLPDLKRAYKICLRLDALIGAVNYGNSYRGTIAGRQENYLWLEDVVHPLLEVSKVIPNTVKLTSETTKIMLVTGPNAGGKTVLLKAIALAIFMNQHGLLVPTSGAAILPTFDQIIFIGGDDQSLSENLSTFSGHLSKLNEGLEAATSRSLLLFDELGQGTSPQDGEALALSVLDFIEELGAFAVVTSHFDRLKERALNDSKILAAAMIFDETKLEPTFRLRTGSVGKSYALEVADRLGVVSSIVAKARYYLTKFNDTPEKRTLQQLEAALIRVKEQEEHLTARAAELERLTLKRQNAIESLSREQRALNDRAERSVEKIVEERLKALDEIWTPDIPVRTLPEMSRIKGELNLVIKEKKSPADNLSKTELEVGAYVKVKKANANGRIVAKNGNFYRVECGGLSIKCLSTDLERLAEPNSSAVKARKTAAIDRFMTPKTGVGLECNLIGLRVEEALEKLGKYLDDCLLMGYRQVRIVHGMGTGALRDAVRRHLDRSAHVESYRFGGEGEGEQHL